MKKIKLYGIGNFEKFNYYIFDKKQEVVEIISKLLYNTLGLRLDLHEEKEDGKNIIQKEINFEKLDDEHQEIWAIGKNERADIFYGNKKIFLSIYCSLKFRAKFNERLKEISLMLKPKKFKPIER
jgi:hypothetical protein